MKVDKVINIVFSVRVLICIAAFLGTMAAFSYVTRDLPTAKEAIVPWFIRLSAFSVLLAVFAGVVVVLVRPLWIVIVTYFIAAVLYPLIIGVNAATLIGAGVFFIFLVLYVTTVARQLNNQVHFSTHPLSDMKVLLFLILSVLATLTFGLGYTRDAASRNYIIPPEVKAPIVNMIIEQGKSLLDKQTGSPAQKKEALRQFSQKTQEVADEYEKKIIPYRNYIPVIIDIILFSLLGTVFLVLSFIMPFVLKLVFLILKITHFSHEFAEMREVRYLTLEPSVSVSKK